MGLNVLFFATPQGADVAAYDRLGAAGVDVDVLDPHGLLAAASISAEGLDLSGERPG